MDPYRVLVLAPAGLDRGDSMTHPVPRGIFRRRPSPEGGGRAGRYGRWCRRSGSPPRVVSVSTPYALHITEWRHAFSISRLGLPADGHFVFEAASVRS